MAVYYNENDPFAAARLRKLIRARLIADGEVDERSIEDVDANDVAGFRQCHWFAGIGGWSMALRMAGWDDDRPVWTGSCPCQPFSSAGKQRGFADSRHLWPEFYRLIRERRPPVVFGEQVAGAVAIGRTRRGNNDENQAVRNLWRVKTILEFCKNWMEDGISECLQELQECCGKSVAKSAPPLNCVQSEQTCCRCETESDCKGIAIRFDCGVGEGKVGCRCLRNERSSFWNGGKTRMEHAVIGQNSAGTRIYYAEHQGDTVCPECGLRELGGISSVGIGAGYHAKKERKIREAIACIVREIERKDGGSWLNTLQADLEHAGYAVGAANLCAAGVGAPHIRQRLYWCAVAGRLEHAHGQQRHGRGLPGPAGRPEPANAGPTGRVAHAHGHGRGAGHWHHPPLGHGASTAPDRVADRPRPTDGYWRDVDWIGCRDGKWRPVKPGIVVLVDGTPGRGALLRAIGNAIVPQVAAEFIKTVMEVVT